MLECIVRIIMCVSAPGLDHSRVAYLYKHIKPFVQQEYRDIMCPVPVDYQEDEADDAGGAHALL